MSTANLINCVLKAVSQVTQVECQFSKPSLCDTNQIFIKSGVLVSLTGDFNGNILITSTSEVFSILSDKIYGMRLENDMLHSFTGEFGNMIMGHASSILASDHQTKTDITPPVVFSDSNIHGYKQGLAIDIHLAGIGDMVIILVMK
ncbi:CheC-like family protein [compost metagenome]